MRPFDTGGDRDPWTKSTEKGCSLGRSRFQAIGNVFWNFYPASGSVSRVPL